MQRRRISIKRTLETEIPIEFEDLLKEILGYKNYFLPNTFENVSIIEYRKQVEKIMDILQYTISINLIQSDKLLSEELYLDIQMGKIELKNYRTIEQLSTSALATIMRIVFVLIGNVPENVDRRVSKKSKYTLNKLRTIQYVQDNVQKANSVKYAIEHSYLDKYVNGTEKQLIGGKYKELRYDADKYIMWVKENYPSVYLALF